MNEQETIFIDNKFIRKINLAIDIALMYENISRLSKHGFDYALLAILDKEYKLYEVWRAHLLRV
jgi:hypothetical protein